jgi:uncharacterized protein with HEPN domain
MPPDRDAAAVLDILTAARLVQEFRGGLRLEAFLKDAKTQSAVIHQFLVMGEAAKRLSDEFKMGHPQVPWRAMARMRDKLIHHYEAIDPNEVWRAVQEDVPALLDALGPAAPSDPDR